MKKYIVFSLLCGLIGATYLQAVPLKRQWACRNAARPISKSSQQRLTKNKCTEAEIKAGRNLVRGLLIGGLASGGAVATTLVVADEVKKIKMDKKYIDEQSRLREGGEFSGKSPLYVAPK